MKCYEILHVVSLQVVRIMKLIITIECYTNNDKCTIQF